MSDLLGGLYFNTGNIDIDKRLFHLAHMSNPEHDYETADALQNWLEGLIGHMEALPIPMQRQLDLASFQIGDYHFRWNAQQIKRWHKTSCNSLREKLLQLSGTV
jgi:hypothetical protein